MTSLDHPIFKESINFIRARLKSNELEPIQQKVLERLIHSSGDFGIQDLLRFTPGSCQIGISALQLGAPILTDTFMAAAAIKPMASRTLQSSVHCVLDWSSESCELGTTRTAFGIKKAWNYFSQNLENSPAPIVVIGSAPTALEALLEIAKEGLFLPSLIIGMPVGFVRVLESKKLLSNSDYPNIRIEGHRGGASLAAATINSLLRAAVEK